MIVLGIDTALGACSAALVDDGTVLARRFATMLRGHAERLFPMVDELFAEAGITWSDVDRIAVTTGPGSFTGTRVGLAAARGIALAAGLPLVGVTSLRAVAAGAEPGLVAVLFDARRSALYGQLFDERGTALTEPFAASADELHARFSENADESLPLLLIGSGAQAGLNALHSWPGGVSLARGNPLPDAAVVARLGVTSEPSDPPPTPLYLRPPDAVPAAPALGVSTASPP